MTAPETSDSRHTLRVTMAAGFEGVVALAIKADVPGVELDAISSGSIDLRCSFADVQKVGRLPYLALVLLELTRMEERSLDRAISAFARRIRKQHVPDVATTASTFRLRVSDAGALVRVDSNARSSLERSISEWASLSAEPRGGGLEIWVSRRRDENFIVLSVRIDSTRTEKVPKGALKPDVAAAIVRVLPPREEDVFFDPFAGSGAIPRARARYPHSLLVATDADTACAQALRGLQQTGALGRWSRVARVDVRAYDQIVGVLGDRKVDAVVTDPPWGIFQDPAGGVAQLYSDMLSNLERVMAPLARIVLLTAATEAVNISVGNSGLTCEDSFRVLVNGRKASVMVLADRNPASQVRI